VRSILIAILAVAGCSGGAKTVHVSAPTGQTSGLVRGGDHVAYLLNISPGLGGTGELHIAGTMGGDTKVASNIAAGGYAFTPDGSALFFTQVNSGGADASLNWVDVKNAGAPKQVIANGLRLVPNNPNSMTGSGMHTLPILQGGFFTPSGKYYVLGVLPPNIGSSWDMHVIDAATGNDVYQRLHGAFSYLELVLPDDTMVFSDDVTPDNGIAGPPAVESLFWVSLPSATNMMATMIDQRVGAFFATSDNKFVVYQRVDDRALLSWDETAHPAMGTMLATATVQFAVGSNTVAYSSGDGSLHVVGVDGSKKADFAAAAADLFSPLILSSDGADLYYFQKVSTQNSQGTLMHVAASGGTPAKVDDAASIFDVRPVPGGLLYLSGLDAQGTLGQLVRAGRDGSGKTMVASGVPVGLNAVNVVGKDQNWLAPNLSSATPNPKVTLVDGSSPTTGTLELLTMSAETKIESQTRLGDYALDDNDHATLVFIGSVMMDSSANNYTGKLQWVPTAMPSSMPSLVSLESVSEITSVKSRAFFANSTSMMSGGVYYVTY
jgi:hypothetical protein